jgi:hypothetical protein
LVFAFGIVIDGGGGAEFYWKTLKYDVNLVPDPP